MLNALAARCEQVYGPARDIEWAYSADRRIYLLQCRAVTHRQPVTAPSHDASEARAEVIGQVPFFTGLSERDKAQIASMFKERTFPAGETIIKEGVGRRCLLRHRVRGSNGVDPRQTDPDTGAG